MKKYKKNKEKKKYKSYSRCPFTGRGRPGAKEEAVYSEINSGPENNNTI